MNSLSQTGTSDLLEQLSVHIDDGWINHQLPRRGGVGRPSAFSSAQLFRVSLLPLLTPARSFNLLVKLLPENRAWRKFARLPNRHKVPDAKMLHEFRDRLSLATLRQINGHLLRPLLDQLDPSRKTVAIIDSTDLAAAALKKTIGVVGAARRLGHTHGQTWNQPLVCRLQEAYPTTMAAAAAGGGAAGALNELGGPCQHWRCAVPAADLALYQPVFGIHSSFRRGGHGLYQSGRPEAVAGTDADRSHHEASCQLRTAQEDRAGTTAAMYRRPTTAMAGIAGERTTPLVWRDAGPGTALHVVLAAEFLSSRVFLRSDGS